MFMVLMCSIRLFFMDSPKVNVYPAYVWIFTNCEFENSKIKRLFYIIHKGTQQERIIIVGL